MIALAVEADREALVEQLIVQMREHRVESRRENLRAVVAGVMADSRQGFILVAKEDARVIGVAYVAVILSIEHGGRAGWLEELYVTPECRGKGTGTALLQAVIEHAGKIGLRGIDLEVDVEHQRAESLYRRFWFQGLPRGRWQIRLPA